jgi:hypothetical protein
MTRREPPLSGMMPLGACLARVTGSEPLRAAGSLRFGVADSALFSPRPAERKPSLCIDIVWW